MRLAGRVAFVAGASSGIGRAVALRFAEEGAHVVAVSRTRGKLQEVVAQIKVLGGSAMALPADVTRGEDVRHAIDAAIGEYGALHVMFNGAGGSGRRFGDGPVADCTEEGWDITLNMNLRNVFLCCKYGIPALLASGGGSIVNLSSILGLLSDRHFDAHAYAAAKAGIVGLSRAIAVYYAAQNIRCNALCPGLITTSMSSRAQADQAVVSLIQQKQLLTRSMGTPAEVADAALFLASDESRFITGVALPVDAGWSAQ